MPRFLRPETEVRKDELRKGRLQGRRQIRNLIELSSIKEPCRARARGFGEVMYENNGFGMDV